MGLSMSIEMMRVSTEGNLHHFSCQPNLTCHVQSKSKDKMVQGNHKKGVPDTFHKCQAATETIGRTEGVLGALRYGLPPGYLPCTNLGNCAVEYGPREDAYIMCCVVLCCVVFCCVLFCCVVLCCVVLCCVVLCCVVLCCVVLCCVVLCCVVLCCVVACTAPLQRALGSGYPSAHCRTAQGSGQWVSFTTPLHWAVGSVNPSVHCVIAEVNGQCQSFSTLPHCIGWWAV